MSNSVDRLQELKEAATDWFDKERRRLEAQWNFLDAIEKSRKGNKGLQDLNTKGASSILANSINDYIGSAY